MEERQSKLLAETKLTNAMRLLRQVERDRDSHRVSTVIQYKVECSKLDVES